MQLQRRTHQGDLFTQRLALGIKAAALAPISFVWILLILIALLGHGVYWRRVGIFWRSIGPIGIPRGEVGNQDTPEACADGIG